ncbi:MAG: LLM class F420-dependent oxidoreductase [Solirubrobacteraceae bacterium]
MRIGYFLSSEEFGPRQLVEQARMAQRAGLDRLWISDHYHPWIDEQGQSPFVWSVIGALAAATPGMHVTTGVTCPTVRIHPAVIAQAAATSAVLLEGRFSLGVGSGEALNEHILGYAWPEAGVRLEMLEEAIAVIRGLWEGGQYSHRGTHYTVQNARIYTLPQRPPDILVSGFGPQAVELAGRIGDGYCAVMPEAELVQRFRSAGGGDKLVQGGTKVCWGPDADECVKTVHRLWPNEGLPGELPQVLPTPAHFEQATQLVTEEMIAESVPCGPDVDKIVAAFQEFADAGYDELYVQQIGPRQSEFFEVLARDVMPRFS